MKAFLFPLLAILLSSCAAIEQAQRASTERLHSAAGFQPAPANTAARQKSLAALTPYKIERKLRGGEFYYLYAVPEQNLVFFGNQEAYGKYQELLIQQEIANANLNAAQMNMSTAQQWNDWSCWGTAAAMLPPRHESGATEPPGEIGSTRTPSFATFHAEWHSPRKEHWNACATPANRADSPMPAC